MLSFSNLSLQKKISLSVLTGLVVALGLFGFLGIQSLNESTRRILDQRLDTARILANNIDENMRHTLAHLQNTARLNFVPSELEFSAMTNPLLQTLADTGISGRNIFFVDTKGTVTLANPRNDEVLGADWFQLPEVKQSLETGKATISNQITEPKTGTQMVLAIVPFLTSRDNILGVLAASIDTGKSSIHTASQMAQAGNTGYVEIVDGNGLVLARTEPGVPPKILEKSDHPGKFSDLIREGKAAVRTCHRCHEVNQEIQRRRDIMAFAPLSTASWGVGIRQSEDEALAPTRQLEMRFLTLGAVLLTLSLFLVWAITQEVVKPVLMLKAAARRVAIGDFDGAKPLKRADEIGQLSESFYAMTQELAKSRNQLVSRNKELTALNALSVAVSQSLNLRHLSEIALHNVMEITQASAGAILLPDSKGIQLEFTISLGTPGIFHCDNPNRMTENCACYQVLRHRETLMVSSVQQCPMLTDKTEESFNSFACIPLQSKDRVLGIMNVACPADRYFTESDFRLFNSIGFQVGLALENSLLYSESKQKEETRGQLLTSIINAQEEERKRISRELHDESGQILTAAIMNIESIENLVSSKEHLLKEKIAGVKGMLVRTLEDLRRLTHDLRPMALDDLGLASAIRAYAKNRLEPMNIQVKMETRGMSTGRRLSPPIETAIFRIIQEATTNIIKHAEAHKVEIQLTIENDIIKATVEDDGKGFEADPVFGSEPKRQPLGLLGIKERVALLGGTFSVRSRLRHGTRLTVEIPAVYLPATSQV